MPTVSVIGAGALASIFAETLEREMPDFKIISVLGRSKDKTDAFAAKHDCQAFLDPDAFIFESAPVIVELAGGAALKQYAVPVLETGRTLICLSTGAFADPDFGALAAQTAAKHKGRIVVVNGAVGGLDFLQTASMQVSPAQVTIETTKAPKSLLGAPGLMGKAPDEKKRSIVFEGSVEEAIRLFPKNINVGVIASLAAEAPDIRVRIISDPLAESNTHKITYRSGLVDAEMTFSGKPDPVNPKSSVTAALSAAACLKNLYSPILYW